MLSSVETGVKAAQTRSSMQGRVGVVKVKEEKMQRREGVCEQRHLSFGGNVWASGRTSKQSSVTVITPLSVLFQIQLLARSHCPEYSAFRLQLVCPAP